MPEGTHLIGSVVQAKAAGMFGHNGSLRLTFRKAQLPEGDERVVHGRVIAAESIKSDRLQIDNEGQIKANGSNRFMAPITLGSLAAVSDSTGGGLIKEALTSNGLDLLTLIVGTAASNGGLISGFAYYEVGKVCLRHLDRSRTRSRLRQKHPPLNRTLATIGSSVDSAPSQSHPS